MSKPKMLVVRFSAETLAEIKDYCNHRGMSLAQTTRILFESLLRSEIELTAPPVTMRTTLEKAS